MKTQMTKTDFTKETPPGFSWHVRHLKRDPLAFRAESMKEINKMRREWELCEAAFTALGSESYDHPAFIDAIERDASLAESAPLMPSDEITDLHPLRFGVEGDENALMLAFGDAGFDLAGVGPDSEPLARVDRGESALDGLVHDDTEQAP